MITHWLAVQSVHACLDLGMDPEGGSFPHCTQEEGLKIQEHLIVPFPVPGWLMRNNGTEVRVATSKINSASTHCRTQRKPTHLEITETVPTDEPKEVRTVPNSIWEQAVRSAGRARHARQALRSSGELHWKPLWMVVPLWISCLVNRCASGH
ncbi:unnamed protein product [Nezara viridula]|uniref:Uncharacterized protein n=1 Tax=Nezara viridula TaxID=85310 RepID=A0A9P0H9M4_NEZVI|nr:unnamed protein product [Nezara viridula]